MGKLLPISPAVFSDGLIDPIASELRRFGLPIGGLLLDPFAGLGHKLNRISTMVALTPIGVEIEPGYFDAGATHQCVQQGDSRSLPFPDQFFDAACTSPAYPNGISDNFVSNEGSVRHTYAHRLRAHRGPDYRLQEGNAGGTNPRRSDAALAEFYAIHEAVWAEVFRVLKPGAPFVVNTKDPLKVPFREDTERQLLAAGFVLDRVVQVEVAGLNHGQNRENKHPFEDLTVVYKPRS